MQPKIPAEFLADLNAVCPKTDVGNISLAFLTDLEGVYPYARSSSMRQSIVSSGDLTFLAEEFKRWRARQQQLLKQYLHKLPHDDPLRSKVSLFATMDYGRLETAHTRALAWLLDDREHGFGFQLLEALLHHLLEGRPIHLTKVDNVDSEYLIQCGPSRSHLGRIDVFAEGCWEESGKEAAWLLIIEAKIDAEEGEDQLSQYDYFLKPFLQSKEVLPVFLTADGREPRTSSKKWKVMSFVELASVFRRVSGLQNLPGYHFLRYYLTGVLKDVCRLPVPISEDCENPYAATDYLQSVLGTSEAEDAHGKSR
jgi:hypothetical protein